MLARVANNLFWMGRYIERSEHIARYMNVNYFSSLDAPNELSQSRQFVLRSILLKSAFASSPPLLVPAVCFIAVVLESEDGLPFAPDEVS